MKQCNLAFVLLFTLFFSAFATPGLAQTATAPVKLTWKSMPLREKAGKKSISVPIAAEGQVDPQTRLSHVTVRIPDVTVATFQLKDPVYVPFTAEEARNISTDLLKASPEFKISSGTANGKTISLVSFVPMRLNPQTGQAEKLTSFEYTFTAGAGTLKRDHTRRSSAATSVLSSGEWFKIAVTGTGIYKIDRNLLQNLGINVQSLDPRRLQLYGNGGGMLPQANAATRHDDLVQNAILVAGEADGQFNNDDYVLFYAQGPHTWKADMANEKFSHQFNVYSDTAYYFLTIGQTPGLRVNTTSVAGNPTQTISTFAERAFHETDWKNMLTSGREWFGEEFNSYTLTRDFTFPLSDLVPGSGISLTSAVLGVSPVPSSQIGGRFSIRINNQLLGVQQTIGHGGGSYHAAGDEDIATFTPLLSTLQYNNQQLRISIAFDQMGQPASTGYLNYLLLNAERQLRLFGDQTSFRSFSNISANAISQFQIGTGPVDPAKTFVWDVTDPVLPVGQNISVNGSQITFNAKTDKLREFIVFTGSNFADIPRPVGRIQNQNLHALNLDGKLDLVIVTHPKFMSAAHRLANHRRQHDKLKVAVVNIYQVYNEFSSGAQDVTAIRDLMKMVYDRQKQNGTKTADSLAYLLLFGDASYDYKSKFANATLNRTQNNNNFVPVYESRESVAPLNTYSSEDYFGLLDDLEGEWRENGGGQTELLDIGIGRLPANSIEEANIMVDKLINYSNPSHFGKWRNRLTFIADDEDGGMHQTSAEDVVNIVEKDYPDYNINKIYLDMFKQVTAPNGKRSPECVAAIDRAVEQGSLVMNYVGHGGETGLAAEQIITINQINNWNNYNNPTFFLTATCEFGRYDDPKRPSAAEYSLLSDKGAAVGLVTTTRPVMSYSNDALNISFYDHAFKPINGRMPRMGEIYQLTKNKNIWNHTVNNRNFALLGDPSMRLAYPEEEVKITSVTVQPGATPTDTLNALATVTLTGAVTNKQQQTLSDFNGKVQVTVFEKSTQVQTLGDETPVRNYTVQESVIYEGVATATNGLFSSTFVVPKDIAYHYGRGKVSLYAFTNNKDAHGAKTDIIIGGSAPGVPLDTIPPVISLFMDNESFVYGGLTGSSSLLISHLSDSSGINTAGLGIGHEITATLDGNKENVKVLNEYYVSDVDNFRSGKVRYLFKNLTPGPHELRVKAWDTHNNSSEKRIEFVVASSEGLALDHVLNYPNPFSTNTTFHFDHNRAGEDLDIQIQIFTVSGKLIRTLNATSFASKPHISEISWNGRDEYNDVLAKGVYIYKLNVRSTRDGAKVSKYEKLVILN
ncbi:MAG TPA: type IX secretion system sortase PorU [Adhaeribacter sp.]|nr:type IX secretion system sortase PorU [Adhaeribacter sp.]